MKFNSANIKVFGNMSFRGRCTSETVEQVTFFNRIRAQHPKTYGMIAVHNRNEGKRHYAQTAKQKAEGMTTGASDIIIPGKVTFVCELKRRDHTQSRWQDGQQEYLEAAEKAGAFAVVALGADAAWNAFNEWRLIYE